MLFIWPTYTAAYFPGEADATGKPPAICFTLLILLRAQATPFPILLDIFCEIKVGNELIALNVYCSTVL